MLPSLVSVTGTGGSRTGPVPAGFSVFMPALNSSAATLPSLLLSNFFSSEAPSLPASAWVSALFPFSEARTDSLSSMV